MDRLVAPSRTWTQMVFEIVCLVFGWGVIFGGLEEYFVDGG